MLDQRLAGLALGEYDWLVLTSANAVRIVAGRLRQLDLRIASAPVFKTAVVGPATWDATQRLLALTPAVMPETWQGSDLAIAIPLVPGQRVLLPQSGIAPIDLADALSSRGANVTTVIAYRTLTGQGGVQIAPLLAGGEIDAIAFASSSAVDGFVKRLGCEGLRIDLLGTIAIACIGQSTASTALAHGINPPIVPLNQTLPGLVDALELALSPGRITKGMIV
jgi:uroporphyrinogen-III synthase